MTLALREIGFDEWLLAPILQEGSASDGPFLLRLRDEWISGACRYDREGEFLLGAFAGGVLAGIGGVSLDPYHPADGLGRVRHLYVLEEHRRRGIARALMTEILARARDRFAVLRLRTSRSEAARLYESFGFARTDAPGETHRLAFQTSCVSRP